MTKRRYGIGSDRPDEGEELVEVDVAYKRDAGASWCVETAEGRTIFLPKSRCEKEHNRNARTDTFRVPEWLAKKEGLI